MPRLFIRNERKAFTWSRLDLPANDAWPVTPAHGNDNSEPRRA